MFTFTIEVNDKQHKELYVAASLDAPNGTIPLTPEELLSNKVQAILDGAAEAVSETNRRNRSEAIKGLADKEAAEVDALLGYTKVEDKTPIKP